MPTKGVALIGTSCEAEGHPTDCQEPAPGTVVNDSGSHNVTVKTTDGEYMIATKKIAAMDFPSHSHDYTDTEGCHQDSSHSLDPRDSDLLSITIAGSRAYPVSQDVQSDPVTGGKVNILASKGNLEQST